MKRVEADYGNKKFNGFNYIGWAETFDLYGVSN